MPWSPTSSSQGRCPGVRGKPVLEIEPLHAELLGLIPAWTRAFVSGFWVIRRYKSISAEKHSSAQAWDLCPLPGCSVQPPAGNSCPRQAVGSKGAWTPGDHFSRWQRLVKEQGGSCWGLCVLQQKVKTEAGLQEGLHCLLQFTFLSAVLKTGGLFSPQVAV